MKENKLGCFVTLLNKVNKVTSYHRHGNPIPKRVLDELSNAQLECEKVISQLPIIK